MNHTKVLFSICIFLRLVLISNFFLIASTKINAHPNSFFTNSIRNDKNLINTKNFQSALTKSGQWGWGPCSAVQVQGNYAFIGNGAMLQVLDISNPSNPKPVGQLLTSGPISNVVISGNYAYTLRPFRIIDISNPTNPILISTLQLKSPPNTITIQGNYAYVGDISGQIFIIDISNSSQPNIVNSPWSLSTSGQNVEAIAISGTYLYAISYDGASIDVFDITNPSSPVHDTSYTFIGAGGALTINGHHLYLGNSFSPQFQVYDISNPKNLKYVNGIDLSALPLGITVIDTLVYISSGTGYTISNDVGLTVVDVADTGNYHIISNIHGYFDSQSGDTIQFGAQSSFITTNFAFLPTWYGLMTVNIQNPLSLKVESYFRTAWDAIAIATDSSNHAFLAELNGGLKILDYSNPTLPQLIGQFDPNEEVKNVAFSNNLCYLLCDTDLLIIDVSNLESPKLIGRIAFADSVSNNSVAVASFICVNGPIVYVARKSENLFAINAVDPSHPKIMSVCNLIGLPVGMSKTNSYLYVANADTGIQIFDVSDPSTPKEKGFLRVVPLSAITISGNELFVLGWEGSGFGEAGLAEYDINNQLNPTLKYILSIPGGVSSAEIATDKNYEYVLYNGIFITVDISSPDSGIIINSQNADSLGFYTFSSIAAYNGQLLVGIADQGVLIMKNNLITGIPDGGTLKTSAFKLFQNFPNPFNPETNVCYNLSLNSNVTLRVYNILGEIVMRKDLGMLQAGIHKVSLNMHLFSSGVYLFTIEAISGNGLRFISTKKMVLLK